MFAYNQINKTAHNDAQLAHAAKELQWLPIPVAATHPELGRYDLRGTRMDLTVLGEHWQN